MLLKLRHCIVQLLSSFCCISGSGRFPVYFCFINIILYLVTRSMNSTAEQGTQDGPSTAPVRLSFIATAMTFNLILGVVAILLNCRLYQFYHRAPSSIAALLYLFLAGWDISVGVSALLHALYFLFTGYVDPEKTYTTTHLVLLSGLYLTTTTTIRGSVCSNVVLSVVRCINISSPFYPIEKRLLKCSYFVFPVIFLGISWYDVYNQLSRLLGSTEAVDINVSVLTLMLNPSPGSSIIDHFIKGTEQRMLIKLYVSNGLFHVGTLLAITCLILQLRVVLGRPKLRTNKDSKQNKSGVRTATTICLLTTAFCACNMGFTVTVVATTAGTEFTKASVTEAHIILFYVTSVMLQFLNSILNPAILILRVGDLREFIVKKFGRRPRGDETGVVLSTVIVSDIPNRDG